MSSESAVTVEKEASNQGISLIEITRVVVISALLLIPCFWHEFLVCVDLGSHTYVAWMASLISAGKVPALYIAFQKTNTLFDWILSAMCRDFGYRFGEDIAVAIVVLVFFWGTFVFLKTLAGRARWDVALPLAMFSYGWTFQTGLFNYYLSVGLALAALGALWTRELRGRILCLVLLLLVALSHPLGLAVFIGFAIFEFVSRRFSTTGVVCSTLISIASMLAVRKYMTSHYLVSFSNKPFWITSGPDQLVLYAPIFFGVALAALFLFLALGLEAIDTRFPLIKEQRAKLIFISALYITLKFAIWLLPDQVQWTATTAMASLLVSRATLVAALLLLAVMALLPAHRWKTIAWGAVTLVFFGALYLSTGTLSRLQRSAYDTVRALPPGSRFIATGDWLPLLGVNNPHLAERACVQHCIVFSNYEIASNQFRVHPKAPSPVVETVLADIDRMQAGTYVIRPEDMPIYSLHPCEQAGHVCVGKLQAGDRNGHPSLEMGTVVTTAHP